MGCQPAKPRRETERSIITIQAEVNAQRNASQTQAVQLGRIEETGRRGLRRTSVASLTHLREGRGRDQIIPKRAAWRGNPNRSGQPARALLALVLPEIWFAAWAMTWLSPGPLDCGLGLLVLAEFLRYVDQGGSTDEPRVHPVCRLHRHGDPDKRPAIGGHRQNPTPGPSSSDGRAPARARLCAASPSRVCYRALPRHNRGTGCATIGH